MKTKNFQPSLRGTKQSTFNFRLVLFIVLILCSFGGMAQTDKLETFEQNGKHGFKNQSGRIVIQPIYDYAGEFSEGLAVVLKNEKCGFIDKTGKEVLPFIYDGGSYFRNDGLAIIIQNKKIKLIDRTGNVVFTLRKNYDHIDSPIDDIAIVSNYKIKTRNVGGSVTSTSYTTSSSTGSRYFGDQKTTTTIHTTYSISNPTHTYTDLITSQGVIDKIGREIIPLKDRQTIIRHEDGTFEVFDNGKSIGFYDKAGKKLKK